MCTYSLIVPYRNRDIDLVRRCLVSLQELDIDGFDYEILFINYGSDKEITQQIEQLCASIPKVTYIYTETRGKFWHKPEALNLAMRLARGTYYLTVDVDMIYQRNFLIEINKHIDEDTLLNYHCYYLPQDHDYNKAISSLNLNDYPLSERDVSTGIFVVALQHLKAINGFDEYYRAWGVEDMDIYKRLQQQVKISKWLSPTKSVALHQWHPKASQLINQPKGWEKIMKSYFLNKLQQNNFAYCPQEDIGRQFTIQERPALQFFERQQHLTSNFTFEYPIEHNFSSFIAQFLNLKSGEFLTYHQSFAIITEDAQGKTSKIMKMINKWLTKIKLSYRITELLTHEYGYISFFAVRDFLFYFLVNFENHIQDYYYQQTCNELGEPEKITLVLVKK